MHCKPSSTALASGATLLVIALTALADRSDPFDTAKLRPQSPAQAWDQAEAPPCAAQAAAMGRTADVMFVEPTHAMERYYRAADVFVLSSVRGT